MALGDTYITDDELIEYLSIQGTVNDDLVAAANLAATESINLHCARDFNQTTTATARVYAPDEPCRVDVDDFHTVTDLVVKTDDDNTGTYETTWTITTDFVLEPFNGIENGRTGFPYRQIVAVDSLRFPRHLGRARLQVTAQWGWAAVPDAVKQANRILAAELFRVKDAPLGVAGINDFGVIRVHAVPQVAMLLRPYEHPVWTVAVG